MDADSTRLQADLRGIIEGDVLCEDVYLQMYASDASIYQIRPTGVIRPRSAADVVACIQYARENHLSVHPRGAGSGLAGEALGRGIVLDMSRYLRRWSRVDERRIRVQSGVVLAQLNRELAKTGRLYGPDPAKRSVTTMGSVLSLDASGSHYLRYGSARNTVESVLIVTAAGELVELSKHQRSDRDTAGRMAGDVLGIVSRHAEHLQQLSQRATHYYGGYHLDQVSENETVDLAKLVTGAEGTLGVILEATVSTEQLPVHRGVSLLFFNRLESAARSSLVATECGAVACDMMDRRLLGMAREMDPRFEQLIPREAEAMLLVEMQDEDITQLRARLREMNDRFCKQESLAFGSRMTVERRERDFFWRISRRVIPRLYRLKGERRALPFIEDIGVAPEKLPDLVVQIQNILKELQITATMFAHAGQGHLNVRPFLNLADPGSGDALRQLAQAVFEKVLEYQGSVTAENGAGLSRSWFLPRQYGPLWPAMIAVKRAFDPAGMLNPGKVVGLPAQEPQDNIRPVRATIEVGPDEIAPDEIAADSSSDLNQSSVDENEEQLKARLPVVQDWDSAAIENATRSCNGCGRCKTLAPSDRMCPVYRIDPSEEASPRAKANLLRGVLTGEVGVEELSSENARRVADLCFGCHQCSVECPASVDVPKIVNELRGQYVATNGLSFSNYLLTRIEQIAPLASRLATVANWTLRSRWSRWLLERTTGLARGRKIPEYATRSFMRWAAKKRLNRPLRKSGPKVAYFVDYFANWHDPKIGEAFVEVLRHNRVGVYVPPRQMTSMMPRIAEGDFKGARRAVLRNTKVLAEAVRQGYQVVTTEPTAALCLIKEYPNIINSDDARLVAENTTDACRFLWNLHLRNELSLDFRPVSSALAYHQPCHVRALNQGSPARQLMELVPGLNVQAVDKGCTGMAGMYGMKQKNYRNSIRIGWPVISAMRKVEAVAASTECSACKNQIEHGSNHPAVHPIKVLAYAYGRLTELPEVHASVSG